VYDTSCTLMLTPWMAPHEVISWQRAIVLVWLDKVDVLEQYDELITSPTWALEKPSVVRLRKPVRVARGGVVRFTRRNVYARDDYTCQYCGERKLASELNYDHVVPRSRGGKTTWDNIVTSCFGCNDRKGDKTPHEAGMRLRRKPVRPTSLPIVHGPSLGPSIPPSWQVYCPVR